MVSVVVLLLLDVLDLLLQLLDRLLLLLDLQRLLLDLQRLLLDLLLVPPLLLLHLPTQPLVLLHQEDISVPGEIVVVESDVCCCFCCCCCSGGVDGDVIRGEIGDIARRGGEVIAVHVGEVLPVRHVNSKELPPRVGLGADIMHRPCLVSTFSVMERHYVASSIKYFHLLTIF